MRKVILALPLLFLASCAQEEVSKQQADGPKNVILMIGDGMGEAEIALTRNYEFDSGPGLYIDTLENSASAIVVSVRDDNPDKFSFVGDSASGATVLATGKLTAVRRISTAAGSGDAIPTIIEAAKAKGFNTGLVTTATITDASPAAFGSHVQNRYCMKAGDAPCREGEKPIIDQYLELGIDVLLGGGQNLLPAAYDNGTVEDFATTQGYKIVKDRQSLLNSDLSAKEGNFLGVFASHHLEREWQGKDGKWAELLPVDENGLVIFPKAERCEANPAFEGMPTLEQMTDRALRELSAKQNDQGFFLMIEGASIDKAAHDADPCGSMGEMLAFDRTIKMVMEYATQTPGTVVIVTADHGGATQNIHHPYYYGDRTADEVPGLYKLLLSKGGHEMVAYYGGNREPDQPHTGINVPVFSYGLPEDMMFKGTIRQTDIHGVMENYLFN